ncbi:hypothetical protein K1T71_008154 [Dendrolimus kikuchii]|uniref:Uncharacterized protein n=1 Tax=Dendrolimus kikuchii TaxID=765133 RepID=A0ACC1CWF7_9NEOP|nr:hypothetical protein K1T71_008154 [Dendrolimus kikuchii]
MRKPMILLLLLYLYKGYCEDDNSVTEESFDFKYFKSTTKQYDISEFIVTETYKYEDSDINKTKKIIKLNLKANHRKEGPKSKDPAVHCSSHQSCYECVGNNEINCGWCHNIGCVKNTSRLCPGVKNINLTVDQSCPYIKHQGPILIPAGVKINLKVKLHAPDPVIYYKEIKCQIKLKNRITHLKGLIFNDIVHCYPTNLDIKLNGNVAGGSFKLIWGGVQPYSNQIPIEVYKCESLAKDCNSCKLLPSEYGCGWCNDIKECVIGVKCNNFMTWHLNRLTCDPYGNFNHLLDKMHFKLKTRLLFIIVFHESQMLNAAVS